MKIRGKENVYTHPPKEGERTITTSINSVNMLGLLSSTRNGEVSILFVYNDVVDRPTQKARKDKRLLCSSCFYNFRCIWWFHISSSPKKGQGGDQIKGDDRKIIMIKQSGKGEQ